MFAKSFITVLFCGVLYGVVEAPLIPQWAEKLTVVGLLSAGIVYFIKQSNKQDTRVNELTNRIMDLEKENVVTMKGFIDAVENMNKAIDKLADRIDRIVER